MVGIREEEEQSLNSEVPWPLENESVGCPKN